MIRIKKRAKIKKMWKLKKKKLKKKSLSYTTHIVS